MRTFKRFLSLALVLVMAISLMSVAVFAEGANVCKIGDAEYATLQEAVNAAKDGDTITVNGTLSDEEVTVKKAINIVGADGATLNNVTINDGTLTGDEEIATVSSKKRTNLGSSELHHPNGATGVTKNADKHLVMAVRGNYGDGNTAHKVKYVKGFNSDGFAVTIKFSDKTSVVRYIPKADLVANANDEAFHYYKLDDILVEGGKSITDITMFIYGGAQLLSRYIPTSTEDTNFDIYLRMKVEGDLDFKEVYTDDAGEYNAKFFLSQGVAVIDDAAKTERTLSLDGLTFTGASAVNLDGTKKLTVENCAFNTTATPVAVAGAIDVEIADTTVNGNAFAMANISVDETFAGSLAVGVATDANGKLIAGTFNQEPAEVAAGYAVKEADGLYTIFKAVAEVDGVKYATLQEAVAAAENGDTVTVLADISDETVTAKKALTITGDATLNNVTINDAIMTADEAVAALTAGDIYSYVSGETTVACRPNAANKLELVAQPGVDDTVYMAATDPDGKKAVVADLRAKKDAADDDKILTEFKGDSIGMLASVKVDGVNTTPTIGNIAREDIVANDGKYHAYKIGTFELKAGAQFRMTGLFISQAIRWQPFFTAAEDAVVDFYVSMRVDGDISCEDRDNLPVYYVDEFIVAYHKEVENTLKLDGLTFTGASALDLDVTELTVENCAFNTTATPIQVNGTASVEVMSTNTVNGKPFAMANISVASDFAGYLAVGVTTDESGKLTAGTFNQEPSADKIAEGYVVKESNGLYEIGRLAAEFNGVAYETLQKAIDAAKVAGGGAVKLTSDQEAGTVILPTGVTLDLQGYTLTAEYLIGLNGSKLMGTTVASNGTGSGKLVVAKDNLLLTGEAPQNASGMSILPVWIEGEGYIFSLFDPINASKSPSLTITEDAISAVFRHNASGYVNKTLFMNNGATPYGLSVKITLTWDVLRDGQPDAKAYQTFDYSDNLIKTIADNKHDYTFNLRSYENMGVNLDSLTVIVTVESDCGVVATGYELDATLD